MHRWEQRYLGSAAYSSVGDIMAKQKGNVWHYGNKDKEMIFQAYLMEGTFKGAARVFGCSPGTVKKIVREFEADDEHKEIRAHTAKRLAGRIHVKADKILDSISEDELQTGYIDIKNKDGEVVEKKFFGPSLVAKATAFGILTDKLRVSQDYINALEVDQSEQQTLIPSTVEGLINGIVQTVKSIGVLAPHFQEDHGNLVRDTKDTLEEVARVKSAQVTLDEFDQ